MAMAMAMAMAMKGLVKTTYDIRRNTMELQTFLLFIAGLTALVSYIFLPHIPAAALTLCAAVALVAGVWWHWTQFSEEYKHSTWQDQLRNYSGFVMVMVVLFCSYGFYAFASKDAVVQNVAAKSQNVMITAGAGALSALSDGFNVMTQNANALFSPVANAVMPGLNMNANKNLGWNRNVAANRNRRANNIELTNRNEKDEHNFFG